MSARFAFLLGFCAALAAAVCACVVGARTAEAKGEALRRVVETEMRIWENRSSGCCSAETLELDDGTVVFLRLTDAGNGLGNR